MLKRVSIAVVALLAVPALAQAASWQLEEKQDPLTDESVSTASLLEGRQGAVVRCKKRNLDTYFNVGDYLGNKLIEVRYRVDKQPLVSDRWLPSADGTAVFASDEADVARQLLSGTTLVIEATDFRGQPHRATFNLEGASVAIEPVLRACGVALQGMEQTVSGLREDIASDLERWGPTYILTQKKILTANGAYNGPLDSTIEPAFALAAQTYYDRYIEDCKAGRVSGVNCNSLKLSLKYSSKDPRMPPLGSIIYETATGALKQEAGKLHIGD